VQFPIGGAASLPPLDRDLLRAAAFSAAAIASCVVAKRPEDVKSVPSRGDVAFLLVTKGHGYDLIPDIVNAFRRARVRWVWRASPR
jgi:hypothetical protein